jgi:predicted phosphodiesterase
VRYLILSDMHANWEAFRVVLRQARRKSFGAYLVLGDLVGYGAAPNQVVEAVQELPRRVYTVRGNHDKVAAAIDSGESFNEAALRAARWSGERLTEGNFRFVRGLPQGPRAVTDGLAICHGSPLDEDAYVFSDFDAYTIFSATSTRLIFFGHTHVPSLFCLKDGGIEVRLLRGRTGRIELDPAARYLINPGSIGQPRDRDPRASYMTYDSDRGVVRWYRLRYPIRKAQERILDAGLPEVLAERLSVGV